MGAIPNKGSNKHSCSAKQANNADDGEYDCLIIKVDQKVLTCEEHEKPHPALAGRRLLAGELSLQCFESSFTRTESLWLQFALLLFT